MKHYKALVSIMLVLAMLLPSCAQTTTEDTETTGTTISADETVEETEEEIKDDLPETNLDGYEFRMLVSNEEMSKFFFASEFDGEVVNDAIRTSILNTENRFGCKISAVIQDSVDEGAYTTVVRNSIATNDNFFDVAEMHDTLSGAMSLENVFLNLHEVNHLNFSQPWYPSNAVESLTVDGKLFLYSSAMSYKGLHQTRILYMNKTMLNNRGLASPYEDVFNGTWTLDKLSTLTKDVYNDLNSNGLQDEEDQFGFTVHQWFDGWMDSLGLHTIVSDPDEVLKLGIGDERTYSIVEDMYNWVFGGNDVYICKLKSGDVKSESDIFSEERSLITYGEISTSYLTYRLTDVDYGMLPFPKYDENQEDYISFYTDRFFVIPATAQNVDTIGLLLEAMSAEGYREIYPAYYEIALKGKYAQDNESVRILDIINESRMMSISYVYYSSPFTSIFGNLFSAATPSADFASFYQKNLKSSQKALEKLIATFEDLDQ